MHSKIDNIKFTSCNDANEVINEFFESFRSRYQGNLEKLMKGSKLTFEFSSTDVLQMSQSNF